MPSRYVTTTTPAAASRSLGNPPTNLNPSTPSISGSMAESSPSNRDPGQRVANPSPIKQFTQAYTAAGLRGTVYLPSKAMHPAPLTAIPTLQWTSALVTTFVGGATPTARGPLHIGPSWHRNDA